MVGWFGDDTAERFEAYGWHVLPHVNGQSSDAVAAALGSSDSVVRSLGSPPPERPEDPPPEAILDRLRAGISDANNVSGEDAVRLAEAVRVLAVRHGPRAVQFCIDLAERLRGLLDGAAGMEESRP